MPHFSENSRNRLDSCHDDLIALFDEVIKERDCTIICGHRTRQEQEALYAKGRNENGNVVDRSKVVTNARWGQSNHNKYPSVAVDVMPYHARPPHIRWSDLDDAEGFARYVLATADRLFVAGKITHRIRWGGDWDQDGIRVDKDPTERLMDAPHYELITQ